MAKVFGVIYGAGAVIALFSGAVLGALLVGAYAAYLLVGGGRKWIIY
jgi:hypothetical protein